MSLICCLLAATPAAAVTRVYWANRSAPEAIGFARLDGTGASTVNTTGATVNGPFGVAFDIRRNRVYWPNYDGESIAFANLDGTGHGGTLNTTGATVNGPTQAVVDANAGLIYWANRNGNKISFARLNGTGGGDLNTTTATVSQPMGVAVDPAAGRIYWTNSAANTISFANLDGTGGGNLSTVGATVNSPIGIAVDTVHRRIYWANWGASKISFANLNGTGGADLNTTGATLAAPEGVAVDVAANRIYWGNTSTPKISFAKLDNTGGGGDLNTTGVTLNWSVFPVVLRSPQATSAPTVSGGPGVGSTLRCSTGSWAGDILPSSLYRAPQRLAYQWTNGGVPVPGATGTSVIARSAGDYRCVVTAVNPAGTASQSSAPIRIVAPPGDSDHDGLVDPLDKCPTTPAGRFDSNHDGCPGPFARMRLGVAGGWTISDKGVQIRSLTVKGLRRGMTLKLVCKPCHVKQTLKAKRGSLKLKKLKNKLLKRKASFTLTATARGFIGDQLTLTVKNYGHTRKAFLKILDFPFNASHRCIPAGSKKPRRRC